MFFPYICDLINNKTNKGIQLNISLLVLQIGKQTITTIFFKKQFIEMEKTVGKTKLYTKHPQ